MPRSLAESAEAARRNPGPIIDINKIRSEAEAQRLLNRSPNKEEQNIGSWFFIKEYDPITKKAIICHISNYEREGQKQKYCKMKYLLDLGGHVKSEKTTDEEMEELKKVAKALAHRQLPLYLDQLSHPRLNSKY